MDTAEANKPSSIMVPPDLGGPADELLSLWELGKQAERHFDGVRYAMGALDRPTVLYGVDGLVVVGANGAGKTRFAHSLQQLNGAGAILIPALRDITMPPAAVRSGAVSAAEPVRRRHLVENVNAYQRIFEQMLVEVHAESLSRDQADARELRRRHELRRQHGEIDLPPQVPGTTRFDQASDIWARIFSHRHIDFRERDRAIVAFAPGSEHTYLGAEMSDGERAAIFLLLRCLLAPKQSTFIVDEPEAFLHKALVSLFWDEIEKACPDSLFVYATHDLDFAASRVGFEAIWLQEYRQTETLLGPQGMWAWERVDPVEGVPESLLLELLGARRPVLFVEGDHGSLDVQLYQAVYPDRFVVPVSSKDEVLRVTGTLCSGSIGTGPLAAQWFGVDAKGLVDRDRMTKDHVDGLERRGEVFVLPVAEVENLLLLPGVVRALAEHLTLDPEGVLQRLRGKLFEIVRGTLDRQVREHAAYRLRNELRGLEDVDGEFGAAARDMLDGVDPGAIAAEVRSEFDDALAAGGDYETLLKLYNQPGEKVALLNILRDLLGLGKKVDLKERVATLAKSGKCPGLVDALRDALPTIPPAPAPEPAPRSEPSERWKETAQSIQEALRQHASRARSQIETERRAVEERRREVAQVVAAARSHKRDLSEAPPGAGLDAQTVEDHLLARLRQIERTQHPVPTFVQESYDVREDLGDSYPDVSAAWEHLKAEEADLARAVEGFREAMASATRRVPLLVRNLDGDVG